MTFDTYNPTKEDLITNAPEGATHYSVEDEDYFFCWYKADGDKWMYKYAEGNIYRSCNWKQDEDINDSRLKSPIPSVEVDDIDLNQEVSGKMDDPVSTRERILEIRKEREAGINEEQDLINKLASMGFKLIEDINEKLEEVKEQHDLQDWRNWKAGDLVTFTSYTSGGFTEGRNYVVREIVEASFNQVRVVADDSGRFNGWSQKFFKFHSRPTK